MITYPRHIPSVSTFRRGQELTQQFSTLQDPRLHIWAHFSNMPSSICRTFDDIVEKLWLTGGFRQVSAGAHSGLRLDVPARISTRRISGSTVCFEERDGAARLPGVHFFPVGSRSEAIPLWNLSFKWDNGWYLGTRQHDLTFLFIY